MQFFIGLLTENGGSVLSADLRRPLLLSHESVEAMEFYKELYQTAYPPGYSARGVSFVSGGVGMQMGGFDHYMQVYRTVPDLIDEIGYFAPRRSPAHQPAVQAFANGLAIPAGAKEPELAWKFIAGLVSRAASPYTATAGAMGPLIDYEWIMQEHPALIPVYSGLDYVFPHPLLPSGTFQRMSDALAPGVIGRVDPGIALRNAEQDLLSHLPDWELPKALAPLE